MNFSANKTSRSLLVATGVAVLAAVSLGVGSQASAGGEPIEPIIPDFELPELPDAPITPAGRLRSHPSRRRPRPDRSGRSG